MLYNVVFGCHGNTCYVIFIGAIFYMIYSTGQINVCTDFEINRFRIDEVRKYATIVCFIWRHVTPTKVMAQIVVFVFSVTLPLTFDLCSIVCHTHCAWCTRISMRSFSRIRLVILCDLICRGHTHRHTHTEGHSNSLRKRSTKRSTKNVLSWGCRIAAYKMLFQ